MEKEKEVKTRKTSRKDSLMKPNSLTVDKWFSPNRIQNYGNNFHKVCHSLSKKYC